MLTAVQSAVTALPTATGVAGALAGVFRVTIAVVAMLQQVPPKMVEPSSLMSQVVAFVTPAVPTWPSQDIG